MATESAITKLFELKVSADAGQEIANWVGYCVAKELYIPYVILEIAEYLAEELGLDQEDQ